MQPDEIKHAVRAGFIMRLQGESEIVVAEEIVIIIAAEEIVIVAEEIVIIIVIIVITEGITVAEGIISGIIAALLHLSYKFPLHCLLDTVKLSVPVKVKRTSKKTSPVRHLSFLLYGEFYH